MEEPSQIESHMTRRDFVAYTAAVAATPLVPRSLFGQEKVKPDSRFNGVQIGTITYSFRSMPGTADDLLNYVIQCGISSVELMGEPAEQFAGAPTLEQPRWPRRGEEITEEQRAQFRAARQARAEAIKEWRTSASMDRFQALKRKYNDAGVNIHIIKFNDIGPNMSQAELNYCFNVAKTLGAKGITTEISEEKARFLAPFAAEHRIMIGFHNHTQVNASSWEAPFSHGEYLGMNLDVGHYVAGTNESPIPIIERYAEAGRILSLHIKDRKLNNGPNMPFGEGDTPLGLILQLMKRNKYTFPADIELEYEIPEDSDAVAEVKRCVEYCRNALADAPEPQNPMRPR
ncbi:MAG: sugar phosphate isomerase/epimerase [Gemmatimonadales bacterium]|nr:sugar phosphate isomerase/epimerase [Gemmatimonadales bacterium]NIN11247.1 sugar phosphate isomerase/epimerase [Gemmatimonadales bacterium]NIN49846.1 sugar phosphate isomerase/epimerase [Gemmatimonadales bacterium]NIP07310.1 sugar phosphate isomerase/epimerase [Gemmatimonadales bacterium]NIR03005.1 sugar phosphate isomerase/epimerase [Gemmatimonadales bacterium]